MNCPICGKPLEDDPDLQRLHEIKDIINLAVPMFERYVKKIDTKQPLNDLLWKVFYETKKNVENHPQSYYEDGNFPRFLDLIEKMITYIVEYSPHYRGYAAYFMLATMDIMSYDYERFPFKRYYAQNKDNLQGISLHDPLAKPKLYLHFLTQHGLIFHGKEM